MVLSPFLLLLTSRWLALIKPSCAPWELGSQQKATLANGLCGSQPLCIDSQQGRAQQVWWWRWDHTPVAGGKRKGGRKKRDLRFLTAVVFVDLPA